MNIFYLDKSPKKSAKLLADCHICKMTVEAAQLMSTAHRVLDGMPLTKKVYVFNDDRDAIFYKSTHVNHPCSIWTRTSSANYSWLYKHFYYMQEEFTKRYGKVHNTFVKLNDSLMFLPFNIPIGPLTTPALAMPDEYKCDDPVVAYKNYYQYKKSIMKMNWTNRKQPDWIL